MVPLLSLVLRMVLTIWLMTLLLWLKQGPNLTRITSKLRVVLRILLRAGTPLFVNLGSPYPLKLSRCRLLKLTLGTPLRMLAPRLARQLRVIMRRWLSATRMLYLKLLVFSAPVRWNVASAPLGVRRDVL